MFLQHFSPVCFIIIIAVAAALPLTVPRLLTIDSDLAMKREGRTECKWLRMGVLVQMGYNDANIEKRCEKKWDENFQEWVYETISLEL